MTTITETILKNDEVLKDTSSKKTFQIYRDSPIVD